MPDLRIRAEDTNTENSYTAKISVWSTLYSLYHFSGSKVGMLQSATRLFFILCPFCVTGGKDKKMKIDWKFDNGEISTVEIEDEEIGGFILESRKSEDNLERKERYHCISYDAFEYESNEFAGDDTPETITELDFDNERINNALSGLSEIQRKRLLMLAAGLSVREIARIENKNYRSVYDSIEGAKKKFLENF